MSNSERDTFWKLYEEYMDAFKAKEKSAELKKIAEALKGADKVAEYTEKYEKAKLNFDKVEDRVMPTISAYDKKHRS